MELKRLLEKRKRLVAGIMSGTSVDGVDVALVELEGSGTNIQIDVRHCESAAYPSDLRQFVLAQSDPATSSVFDLSQLNVRLAHVYSDAVLGAVARAGLQIEDLDLIGSHGQTVHHIPVPTPCAGAMVTSTLQVGDPAVLAQRTGVCVVGDFRLADMAWGGQGAPLVPYLDYVFFRDKSENRLLLNLGGIANMTVLPAACSATDVVAFDTGPANMVLDLIASAKLGQRFDENGKAASKGIVHEDTLRWALADAYFAMEPPKSTGREHFGEHYATGMLQRLEQYGVADANSALATALELTVESVAQAYERFVLPNVAIDRVIAAGGGTENDFLMARLRARLGVQVDVTDAHGVIADAKEAVCFAVLAHEYLNGASTNLPSVTGAERATLLGKLCLPPPNIAQE